MKKKLITLILCGVIGGTSIVGVSKYKMSQEANETQTLVEAPEKEDINSEVDEKSESKDNAAEVEQDEANTTSGQADEKLQSHSQSEDTLETMQNNDVKSGQDSSGQTKNESVSNENEDNTTNGGLNNNGSNNNEGTTSGSTPSTEESGSFFEQVEQLIFNRVNEERAKAGVPALSYNSVMETYARLKSKDMGVRNYFDHMNPEGELITAQMARDGIGYNAWGENIAYIGGVTDATALAEQFMTNWMNSQGHKENILSTNFTSIGIGVYKSGNRYYATQEFYK